jgi:hypothetical protein
MWFFSSVQNKAIANMIRVENLPVEEIAELLAATDDELSDELSLAREEFIEHIGGYQNARNAVEMLAQLSG